MWRCLYVTQLPGSVKNLKTELRKYVLCRTTSVYDARGGWGGGGGGEGGGGNFLYMA